MLEFDEALGRRKSPYIIRYGESQYFVAIGVAGLMEALEVLMALYYIYDIEYPGAIINFMLFLEKYLVKLRCQSGNFSGSAVAVITDLKNSN